MEIENIRENHVRFSADDAQIKGDKIEIDVNKKNVYVDVKENTGSALVELTIPDAIEIFEAALKALKS